MKPLLAGLGLEIRDIGVFDEKPADYPDIAAKGGRTGSSRGSGAGGHHRWRGHRFVDRRQQSLGHPRGALLRPRFGPQQPRTQQCQCADAGCAAADRGPGGRSLAHLAGDAFRGRQTYGAGGEDHTDRAAVWKGWRAGGGPRGGPSAHAADRRSGRIADRPHACCVPKLRAQI